jgi:glycosyltransferase involved in cell wall biosynthesis
MNIILYNPNSSGGNFDYVLKLAEAYTLNPAVESVSLLMPGNALTTNGTVTCSKILLSDMPGTGIKFFSQVYFVFRTFVNPLRFYFFLRKSKSGYVVFNDYDQVSSFFWAPIFRGLKKRYIFSVILHDPDRDRYLRFKFLSDYTMRKVMSIMDIAFYHDKMPQKPYYRADLKYVSVPHGLYNLNTNVRMNACLNEELLRFKGDDKLIGAVGNIRNEKNYLLIIKALKKTRGIKLLISGVPASSSVSVNDLKETILKDGLSGVVMINEKYADEGELKAIGEACDAFIMYYSDSFKSQSGILNLFASYQKPLLVGDNESPLASTVRAFNLGLLAPPDSEKELLTMLDSFKNNYLTPADWQGYFKYASWHRHVILAIAAMKDIRPCDR